VDRRADMEVHTDMVEGREDKKFQGEIMKCTVLFLLLATAGCASVDDFANVPLCSPITGEMRIESRWKFIGISSAVREADGKLLCKRAMQAPASGEAK
jgi:hypothetical protein